MRSATFNGNQLALRRVVREPLPVLRRGTPSAGRTVRLLAVRGRWHGTSERGAPVRQADAQASGDQRTVAPSTIHRAQWPP